MGNGPGDIEDYLEVILPEKRIIGAFVWEWCDHAIAHGKTESGKTIYYYGGDHDEELHDGNFCMDGLVFPDRTPHTGILEYKNVYRPVRVVSYDQETGKLVLHNYLDFDDLKDYLDIRFEVIKDGLSTVQKRKTFSILCNATYRRRDRVKRNHSQRRKNLFETDIPFKEGNTFPEEKFHSWI